MMAERFGNPDEILQAILSDPAFDSEVFGAKGFFQQQWRAEASIRGLLKRLGSDDLTEHFTQRGLTPAEVGRMNFFELEALLKAELDNQGEAVKTPEAEAPQTQEADQGETPPETTPPEPESKGVATRDKLFLEWYEAKGLETYHRPAAIYAKWSSMTKQERAVVCPEGVANISKHAVVQAIKRLQKKREAKPTPKKRRRRKRT